MARPLRIDIEDGVYHVTARSLEGVNIARSDSDRMKWLDLLDRVAVQRQWRVFAWALMGNHFHLYLRTPNADLSAGMHDLNSGYVSVFNRRHGRSGPLLRGRFKGILVESEAHDWELTRYVHLNPVRAALVAQPQDYRWSSCAHYFDHHGAPPWLAWDEVLVRHGRTLRAARRAYADYLAEGIEHSSDSPLDRVTASTLLGSPRFIAEMLERLADASPDENVPALRELPPRITIEDVEDAVCEEFRVSREFLHSGPQRPSLPRYVAMYLVRKLTGTSIHDVGERYRGVSGSAVSKTCVRMAERLETDTALASRIEALGSGLDI